MNLKGDNILSETIAGYCRISVDEEIDRDNTSIENQKKIIKDFKKNNFPNCELAIYEDRDRSGYTFEQREQYQKLRKKLISGEIKLLIVKDFSRFSRRNSKGLVELEDLRDAGVRIISIGDSIDYPTYDDWTSIQFRFLINEMPVTDASKKVRSVIRRKQEDGEWVNIVPYGYIITNMKKQTIEIEPEEAEVIRKVFQLYNEGWGYKKIANHLTDKNIPTPRMKEKLRAEARGDECRRDYRKEWSIVTIQGILNNDFYIGTLRQHKYKRKNINGIDVKTDTKDHIVFENHHPAIVDYKVFAYAQEQLKMRTSKHTNYRGIKKYDTTYSGFLFCGECGSPMFSMSRSDMAPAYVCGSYHKRGLKGCTSHHTRVDLLDNLLKRYIKRVKVNSKDMLEELEKSIKNESIEVKENDSTLDMLQRSLAEYKEELKITKKRKIKELAKNPKDEDIIEETYLEIEQELIDRINGLQYQIEHTTDKRNEIIRVNRVAKTAMEIFDDILNKEKLDKRDLELIVNKIVIYENRIDIKLKNDIDSLFKIGKLPIESDEVVNFEQGSKDIKKATIVQSARNQRDKVFTVNVINSGDPLEIFTDREGEIILKKYSPIGEITPFAKQYAESLAQVTGHTALIADRDQFIAVAGGFKDLSGKSISKELEEKLSNREMVLAAKGEKSFISIAEGHAGEYVQEAIAPIICEGDIIGAVALLGSDEKEKMGTVEQKLILAAAGFLGRQMEQ